MFSLAALRELLGHFGGWRIAIRLAPVPASRPKVGRWGTYYPKTYANWKKAAVEQLAAETRRHFDGPLAVVVEQICHRPKTGGRLWPKGDADNHAKGPLDALTQATGIWDDDDQVVCLIALKRFADKGEEPRTEIQIVNME